MALGIICFLLAAIALSSGVVGAAVLLAIAGVYFCVKGSSEKKKPKNGAPKPSGEASALAQRLRTAAAGSDINALNAVCEEVMAKHAGYYARRDFVSANCLLTAAIETGCVYTGGGPESGRRLEYILEDAMERA